jgi:hypothetical protein
LAGAYHQRGVRSNPWACAWHGPSTVGAMSSGESPHRRAHARARPREPTLFRRIRGPGKIEKNLTHSGFDPRRSMF